MKGMLSNINMHIFGKAQFKGFCSCQTAGELIIYQDQTILDLGLNI